MISAVACLKRAFLPNVAYMRYLSPVAKATTFRAFSSLNSKIYMSQSLSLGNSIKSNTYGESVPDHILNVDQSLYDKKSDTFLMDLNDSLEDLSEINQDFVSNIESNQGVLQFDIANVGTYVINKQPPNKQIWLSSPISGPFRFDYDSLVDDWVSLRDHGDTKLLHLLNQEIAEASGGKYRVELAHCD